MVWRPSVLTASHGAYHYAPRVASAQVITSPEVVVPTETPGSGRAVGWRRWAPDSFGLPEFSLPELRRVVPHLVVAALMLAYTIYYSRLTVEFHRGYGTPGFDFGIPDQGIWLLSRFKAPFVTIMGRNLFADHTSFILLLLVPVYWFYPHGAALLVIQSGLLALGALPVYALARKRLGSPALAIVLAGAFLLHPALQWGNLEQFHAECFLVPLIGAAIYAAVEWRPWLLIASVGLCLLVKEDVAFLILPLGVWVAMRRSPRTGARIVVAAVVASFVATQVVMRGLFGIPELHADRLPFGGGLHHFATAVVRTPGKVLDYLRSDRRPFYAWQMTFPSALVFVRSVEVAAIGVGVLAVNIISDFGYQHQVHYHYSMPLVPVIALGTVFAIGTLKARIHRIGAVAAVAVCSVWACFLWGALPAFSMNKVPHWKPSDPRVHDINFVRAALPPNAVVSAYYSYISHVDHRQRVYQWPTPFKAAYWADFKQEGQRLAFADQVRYLFLPLDLDAPNQALLNQILPEFHVVRQLGNSVLLERDTRRR
jgi:uncharacterized membrane protein